MPTNKRETEIIMDHVFKNNENNENLKVALDIISRTQEIRSRIIKPFLEKLKSFICEELDMSQWGWETELYCKPYGGNNYRRFGVLQESVSISLSANPMGNDLYIGVFSSNQLCNNLIDRLKRKLDAVFRQGNSDDWGVWYQPLSFSNRDYTDWTNKHTLIKMHTDPDRVVEDIGNHLLRIIEVAKPEIEEWVKQNPPAQ